MNLEQRKYATRRVEQVLRTKLQELKLSCTKKGVSLSSEQKAKAFKSGKWKVNQGLEKIRSYDDVNSIITFTDEKPSKFDQTSYDAKEKKLNQEAGRITDLIMLGEPEKAIKFENAIQLLQKFKA